MTMNCNSIEYTTTEDQLDALIDAMADMASDGLDVSILFMDI
jgi:transcription-repair coupling factor (superfamily II helicase)